MKYEAKTKSEGKKTVLNLFQNLLAAFLISLAFFGCSKKDESQAKSQNQKIKVVATIFPLYDWAKNVAAGSENVQVELLIKNGVDLHSFQPSTSDIVNLLSADVLIYVGGESDFWISDALKNSVNEKMAQINLMEALSDSVKEEEVVDGMTAEDDDFPHIDKSAPAGYSLQLAGHNHDEVEYDEHLWLSVKNAENAVKKISEILQEKDAAEADLIESNKNAYLEKLDELQYSAIVTKVQPDTIIVCDRFPFRYLTDELGLKYYAAFVGCSAETEASFETIAFLAQKIKDLNAKEVFVTESSDKKIARTVISSAGLTEQECKIVTLDSMQSTTLQDSESGKNYVDVMKENYRKLAE